ncbi:STAS domain-containing protein [Sporosarcina sp. P21c]|uniref:STAS domain-containing protein n=1 Tax=Sporosarcina TaxID=1569 RepID=UPI000A16B6F8|nr:MULTISPECIES: STAS domain-containing protein [Sporosarcina]ARJ40119.1 sulfate transporter [Sporosarcina ureae]PIC68684.1 STAS domain-containing protein [Sporosarcina sp. P16a]PIC84545.1 STAS domain-containing protein [Sporosarcina sp. P1]PIC91132.1 STAS domain-containing protein [Sporosarcina sp. P21c]PIC93736.1 STAS domain-containing protein [Sporosarcina sp. P25]
MKQIDVRLYEYLLAKLPEITTSWLAMRKVEKDSIYSLNAQPEMEETLREQNKLTNLTVISSLLDDPEIFEKNKSKWAAVVALSRVNSNTPIEDVIDALSNVRLTYWRFVKEFYLVHKEEITIEDYMRWSDTINNAFDQIYINFAQTYNEYINSKFDIQQSLINELSSPVIKITEKIGVVPLIGDMDELRARSMLESIPDKSLESDIEHLFIDLSGVNVIDTLVAQQIFQVTKVLSLLGTRCTITGILPAIAQASTELGLDFKNIQTFSSLQLAFSKEFLIVEQ